MENKRITLLYELEVWIGDEEELDNHDLDYDLDLCENRECIILCCAYLDKSKAVKDLESWAQKNNAEKQYLDADRYGYRAVDNEYLDDIKIIYRWLDYADLVV